jgi:hypothetical protein
MTHQPFMSADTSRRLGFAQCRQTVDAVLTWDDGVREM